ncbi:MAG: hypothetical protein HQL75_05900 [Magnetococcales bacterium]|nr:hypothetical protein [Magnetococcales bacterium]
MPTKNKLSSRPTPDQTLFSFPSMDTKKAHEKEVKKAKEIIAVVSELLKIHVTNASYPNLMANAINTSLARLAAEIGGIGYRRDQA